MAVTKIDLTRQATNSGAVSWNSHQINNLQDPTSAQDAATKNYVDMTAQGLSPKASVRVSTVGTETFTILAGAVTVIAGTTIDGISPAIGDRILIKDAPASTGSGSVNSAQPGNGIYVVSANVTNLTVARSTDMSGTNGPAGAFVFVEAGTTWASSGFVVSTPNTNTGFSYGTNNIQWTQFSGAGEITAGNVLTKIGNTIQVNTMTTGQIIVGNGGTPTIVTMSGDIGVNASGVTTIQAAAVTLAKMANLAANSVIANVTGSSATPTAVALTAAATVSSVVFRDSNGNTAVNGLVEGLATTATAAGTTTLTVASKQFQQFTGTTTQTVVLPDATTLSVGQSFFIANRSTGVVTVNANGGGLIQTMAANSQVQVTVVVASPAAGTWDAAYSIDNAAGGTVTSVSVVNTNGFNGTVATATTTPAITISTTVTGILKGNGTAISAATAGTDYMAPSDFVTRETPSGTINGSNTTFTLANTPIAGTEMVFLNGILQEPGAGNDYTISGATITYLSAPLTGDRLRVTYQK